MEENRLALLEAQIAEQGKVITEIKETQLKIAQALLGDLGEKSIGLIEEVRNLKTNISNLPCPLQSSKIKEHEAQIQELLTFKNDIKKIVAGIAIVIPFLVEIIKFGLSAVWELLKMGPK